MNEKTENEIKTEKTDDLDNKINNILKENKIDDNKEVKKDNEDNKEIEMSVHSFVVSIGRLSKFAGRKLKYQSLIMDDDDLEELEFALNPLQAEIEKLFKYTVYLPLIVFVAGYSLNIYEEYEQKHPKKDKNLNKKIKKQSELKNESKH